MYLHTAVLANIMRYCVARRRTSLRSEKVLWMFETGTDWLREERRSDKVQLSTPVQQTDLRLHRQPGWILQLLRWIRQTHLPNEPHDGRDKIRLLRFWGYIMWFKKVWARKLCTSLDIYIWRRIKCKANTCSWLYFLFDFCGSVQWRRQDLRTGRACSRA